MSDSSQRAPHEFAYPEPPREADSSLSLIEDIERNLLASQRALLSGDLHRLEKLTAEQGLFARKLADVLRAFSVSASAITREVRAAQLRVLHLGRVHIALLARQQQRLRTLRHRLAGPQSLYGPPASSFEFGMERKQMRVREA